MLQSCATTTTCNTETNKSSVWTVNQNSGRASESMLCLIHAVKTISRKTFNTCSKMQDRNVSPEPHLPSNINGDANNHGGDSYAGDECDADRGTYKCSQLPKDLLLSAPWLLSPESTAWWTERGWEMLPIFIPIFHISDFNLGQKMWGVEQPNLLYRFLFSPKTQATKLI